MRKLMTVTALTFLLSTSTFAGNTPLPPGAPCTPDQKECSTNGGNVEPVEGEEGTQLSIGEWLYTLIFGA